MSWKELRYSVTRFPDQLGANGSPWRTNYYLIAYFISWTYWLQCGNAEVRIKDHRTQLEEVW